mgnify:FL=1
MGLFGEQDRRQVAVVITTDGRRVHLPIDDRRSELSLLVLIRSLGLGLEGLLGLIGKPRRDRGTRRNG